MTWSPAETAAATRRNHFYVDGKWAEPDGTGRVDIVNPTTEELLGWVPAGTPADVDAAVQAARVAFDGWSATPVAERAAYVRSLGEMLTGRVNEIGVLVAREVGTPLGMATLIQAGLPALVMSSYAELATGHPFEEELGNSLVVREPVGVVAAITPWNFPLHQAVAKVAPALAAGCTVVLKPSEVAPLTLFLLAEMADEAGLPPGVLNLVTGAGSAVGEALVAHPEVDMVSFTGSTAVGAMVGAAAAGSLKRITLELGGKSANVVLDDADLEEAVRSGVRQCYLNGGQSCMAWSRMLVPRSLHDEAATIAASAAGQFVLGDPLEPATTMGPMASATQQERVRSYIRKGVDEGATLVTGGDALPAGRERGYFVSPTVFASVDNAMTIARDEIFGPVVSIIPYEGDDEAVHVANDTDYGLHGAVYSRDRERAERVARRLRTGQVDINNGGFNPIAPFGGYKRSGQGRELGRLGLDEYLETKSLQR